MKNLLTRTVSGIVFIGIMVGCLLGGAIPYASLMQFLLVGMLSEFYALTLGKGKGVQKTLGILLGMALWWMIFLLFGEYSAYIPFLVAAAFVLWIALFVQQLYRKDKKPFTSIAFTLLGVIYIAVPLSLMNLLVHEFNIFSSYYPYNGYFLLSLFIILWCSDVGAYVFGMLFGQKGKHKLFPSVSPKKSWEGFIGGLLAAVGAGYALPYVLPQDVFYFSVVHTLVIAVLISVFGMFGDLVESMLKRSAGVKDSGKLIPGHGGLLDRFDAALLALPVVCLYIGLIMWFNV
jgi:phosphatidate cytidylyltransferase